MKPIFAVDTNCLIAAVSVWDKRHAEASAELEVRLARGEQMSISVQALTETYSVLTRLPLPFRVSSSIAWELLEFYLRGPATVFAMESTVHVETLRALAQHGIGGGRTHDAIIAECARRAGASTLLTFNGRHFDPPPQGVTIVEPSI